MPDVVTSIEENNVLTANIVFVVNSFAINISYLFCLIISSRFANSPSTLVKLDMKLENSL